MKKKPLVVKSIGTKQLEEREEALRGLMNLVRRAILRVSAAALGAVAGACLVSPHSFQPVTVASAQPVTGKVQRFQFAYNSDSHRYERTINYRFINALM